MSSFMKTLACAAAFVGLIVVANSGDAQVVSPPLAGPTITPVARGLVTISYTYLNPNGKVITGTLQIIAVSPLVFSVIPYNAFNPPRWIDSVTVGKPFCVFASAFDSLGNVITGLPVTFKSSDTTVAKIGASIFCPTDTTIDAKKMTVNPQPPLLSLTSLLNLTPSVRP